MLRQESVLPGRPQRRDGCNAPKLWLQENTVPVIEYVAQDVHQTLLLRMELQSAGTAQMAHKSRPHPKMSLTRGWLPVNDNRAYPYLMHHGCRTRSGRILFCLADHSGLMLHFYVILYVICVSPCQSTFCSPLSQARVTRRHAHAPGAVVVLEQLAARLRTVALQFAAQRSRGWRSGIPGNAASFLK